MDIKSSLDMLGCRVEDKVTGFTGITTSVSFDLYGCIQALVHPGMDEKGKLQDLNWFDVGRLTVLSEIPVMDPSPFEYESAALKDKGPEVKPSMGKP